MPGRELSLIIIEDKPGRVGRLMRLFLVECERAQWEMNVIFKQLLLMHSAVSVILTESGCIKFDYIAHSCLLHTWPNGKFFSEDKAYMSTIVLLLVICVYVHNII